MKKKKKLIITSVFIVISFFVFSFNDTKALEQDAGMSYFQQHLFSAPIHDSVLRPGVTIDTAPPFEFVQESAFFNKVESQGYNLYEYTSDGVSQYYGYNTTYFEPLQNGAINSHNYNSIMWEYPKLNNYNSSVTNVPFYDSTTNTLTSGNYVVLYPYESTSSSYTYLGNHNYKARFLNKTGYSRVFNSDGSYSSSTFDQLNWRDMVLGVSLGNLYSMYQPGDVGLLQFEFTSLDNTLVDFKKCDVVVEKGTDKQNIYTLASSVTNRVGNNYVMSILFYFPNGYVPTANSYLRFYIEGVAIGQMWNYKSNLWTSHNTTSQQIINLYNWLGDQFVNNPEGTPNPPGGGGSSGGSCSYNFNELKTYLDEKFSDLIKAVKEIDIDQTTVNNINAIINANFELYADSVDLGEWNIVSQLGTISTSTSNAMDSLFNSLGNFQYFIVLPLILIILIALFGR